MKRIVWIGVAILVMLCILGYGLHTLNRIDEVNKERREKSAGQAFASQIAMTTVNTSIWDKLRATETVTETAAGDGAPVYPGNPDYPVETGSDVMSDDNEMLSTSVAYEEEPIVPEAPTSVVSEQTTTTTGFVIQMD